MLNKKIKAFTLAELLVTLALTSMMVTFSYMGLSYIQKLLYQYRDQNHFITQLNEINNRINIAFDNANTVQQAGESTMVCNKDSSETKLEINPAYILTVKSNKTDTFRLETKNLRVEHEKLAEGSPAGLIKKMELDIYFQKQKFHLIFIKNYDGYSKLNFETRDVSH